MIHTKNLYRRGIALILITLLTTIPLVSAGWSSIAVMNSIAGKVVYPGDTVEFTITVKKGYNSTDEAWCALSISSKPENWSAGFYNNGDQITHVTFPADKKSQKEVTLRIKTPADASNGAYSIMAKFKPDDGKVISREFVVTIDNNAQPNLDMYSNIPGLETRPNDPVEFEVILENKYDHRVTVDINATGIPESWNVEFLKVDDGKYRVTKASVAANDKQDLIVKVHPAINASDGTYPVIVNAVVENGGTGISQQLDLTINRGLEESKMLTLFPNTRDITLNPGASREFVVNLRNSGDRILNNVEIKLQDVSGISTSVRSFGPIDELEPGESREIPVMVSARADASPGEKEILMRALSDEAQSEDNSMQVVVVKSNSSGFLGIGLVLVAVFALIIIIFKFGRR